MQQVHTLDLATPYKVSVEEVSDDITGENAKCNYLFYSFKFQPPILISYFSFKIVNN